MSKSLINAFNIKEKKMLALNDYDIFKDKETLDKLKNAITFDIIDDVTINNSDIEAKINNYTKDLGLSNLERQYLYNLIDNEINGVGPITEVMNDPSVKKIFVNSPSSVYVLTKDGYYEDTSISFINNEHIIKTVKRLATINHLNITFDKECVKFKTKDNTKISLIMPPVSENPILTIVKEDRQLQSIEELIRLGTLTPYMARFLAASVAGKLNILVCGSKNSGKTTLINALMQFIPKEERLIYVGFKNNKANDRQLVSLNTDNIEILEQLNSSYMIYSNDNILNLLNLVNKRSGIISSFDTRTFSMDNIVNNVLLKVGPVNKEVIMGSILTGFDLIVFMDKGIDDKIRVTSIKELVNQKELREVFGYKNKTFDFNRSCKFVYNKLKTLNINNLDDMFEGE